MAPDAIRLIDCISRPTRAFFWEDIKWPQEGHFIGRRLWNEGANFTSSDMQYGIKEEPKARLRLLKPQEWMCLSLDFGSTKWCHS